MKAVLAMARTPFGLAVAFAMFALSAAWAFRDRPGPREGAETIAVTQTSVPAPASLGKLEVISVAAWASADPRFAGWSDLRRMADGRLLAISDMGYWMSLPEPAADAVALTAEVGVLRGADGLALRTKQRADAEGLALLADGRALVSFEGQHRIDVYDLPARGFMAAGAPSLTLAGIGRLGGNTGLEALALLPDGRVLAGAESGEIWIGDLTATAPAPQALRLSLALGWMLTAAAAADDTLFMVWRFFNPFDRSLAVEVRACPLAGLAAGRLDCALLATLSPPFPTDNFEALDVVRESPPDAAPVYLLTLLSDDNASRDQRTLYARFRFRPG